MTLQVLDIVDGNKFSAEQEKATGTDGVIIKGGQGQREYVWGVYADACQVAGLPWGIYWVVDARYSAESQKAALKAAFPTGNFGPLGLWLDVEKPVISMPEWIYRKLPYAYYKTIESIAQSMLQHSKTGVGIYTSPGQWQLCAGIVPQVKADWFATLPLWTAQYKVSKPDMYGAWKSYVMWQYQEGPDFSVADETWWGSKVGGVPLVPPTPAPEPPVIVPEPGLRQWQVTVQTQDQIVIERK